MNTNPNSVRIVIVIWIAAVVLNTLFGTAYLTSLFTDAEMVGAYALVGFVFTAIFTLPLVLALFLWLKLLVRMEFTGRKLFFFFFAFGILLTSIVFLFFSFTNTASLVPVRSLFLVAIISGSLAMLLEYRSVVHLRKSHDEADFTNFLKD